jgi:hypothetical protein
MVLLLAVLFLILSTQLSIKHWLDDIGVPVSAPEEMQRHLYYSTINCLIIFWPPYGVGHLV